jgi:16S rRNA (guanine966-N2)-methyltransferase
VTRDTGAVATRRGARRRGRGPTLRVVAGAVGGRRLTAPPDVRPTTARVREALFASLGDVVVDASVLDLYAGSGALAVEALSRGAARAVLVDDEPAVIVACEANVASTGFAAVARVRRARAATFVEDPPPPDAPFALVLVDPPYDAAPDEVPGVLAGLTRPGWLTGHARVVVETATADAAPEAPPGLDVRSRRRYGDTLLSTLGPVPGS